MHAVRQVLAVAAILIKLAFSSSSALYPAVAVAITMTQRSELDLPMSILISNYRFPSTLTTPIWEASCVDVCHVLTLLLLVDLHSVAVVTGNQPSHHWNDPTSLWQRASAMPNVLQ